MEIKSIISKKRILFNSGELPFDSLLAPENSEKIRQQFKFEGFSLVSKNNAPLIQGTRGQFTREEKIHAIMEMNIQQVSLEVLAEGETVGADILLSDLERLLRSFSVTERPKECTSIETSYETFCICRIETDPWWQFSQPYSDFINKVVFPKVAETYQNAEPLVQPESAKLRFFFKMKGPHHYILPKTFSIELREGTPPEDRIYWTTSPLRSEDHLQILKQFEQTAGTPS